VKATFQSGDVDLTAPPGPSGMNDNIESVYNGSGMTFWCIYTDKNYNGTHDRFGPATGGAVAFPNQASSVGKC
jgi:hypothetical protein